MTIETHPENQEDKNKVRGFFGKSKKRIAAAAGAVVLAIALVAGACAGNGNSEPAVTGGEVPERAEGTEGREGPEGAEGTEGREGPEGAEGSEGGEGSGMGEAAEGGHGGAGGSGEAAEGGNVNMLGINQTHDETIAGARLRLAFDPAANAFVGTADNTTNQTLTRVRVEVHLSNGTELGPTTPTNLAPGQTLRLTLPSTAAPFDTWSAHVEVGSGEAGEGSGGGEGSEGAGHEGGGEGSRGEGANEGPEGTEGTASGGQAAGQGQGTYLASTGVSRGVKSTQVLGVGDSYAGKLNDLELAITYDDQNDRFVARVKNEAAAGICDTSVRVIADGQPGPQSLLIPALDVGGRADFTLEGPQTPFNTWQAQTETFTCTATPSHPGEGGEAGGGESGSESGGESGGEGPGHESGGSEGGGEGSGAESGEETSPATPVSQPVTGTFNNLDYRVAYDRASNSFMATVTNNTNQTVCASRLEIHMGAQGQVIELGPTIGVDLQPGESIDVVLSADPMIPDTYSIHPESSPCP